MTHYYKRNAKRDSRILSLFLHLNRDLVVTARLSNMKIAATRNVLKAAGEKFPKTKLHPNSACHKNQKLVFEMEQSGSSLDEIGRRIGTGGRHVKRFLREHGVTRDFLTSKKAERHYAWKGGRIIDKDGYATVYCPDHPHRRKHTPYILEHRLVMEKMIGRFLLPEEVVHHRDKNKQNNSPENLQLFSENREHLAQELKGCVPNWSPEGFARMKESGNRTGDLRRGKSPHLWLRRGEMQSP